MKLPQVNNPLLFWTIVVPAIYIIASLPAEPYWTQGVMNILLLAMTTLTLKRYTSTAWDIVVHKRRLPSHDSDVSFTRGSYLGVYGIWLIAFGLCYIACYTLIYIAAQQPESWRGSATGAFGRLPIWIGLFMMYVSPDIKPDGVRLPRGVWVVAVLVLCSIIAFIFGLRIGQYVAFGDDDTIPGLIGGSKP